MARQCTGQPAGRRRRATWSGRRHPCPAGRPRAGPAVEAEAGVARLHPRRGSRPARRRADRLAGRTAAGHGHVPQPDRAGLRRSRRPGPDPGGVSDHRGGAGLLRRHDPPVPGGRQGHRADRRVRPAAAYPGGRRGPRRAGRAADAGQPAPARAALRHRHHHRARLLRPDRQRPAPRVHPDRRGGQPGRPADAGRARHHSLRRRHLPGRPARGSTSPPLPPILVKGRAEPVPVYRPQGQARLVLRAQAMVGRMRERARAGDAACKSLAAGHGRDRA